MVKKLRLNENSQSINVREIINKLKGYFKNDIANTDDIEDLGYLLKNIANYFERFEIDTLDYSDINNRYGIIFEAHCNVIDNLQIYFDYNSRNNRLICQIINRFMFTKEVANEINSILNSIPSEHIVNCFQLLNDMLNNNNINYEIDFLEII